MVNDSYVKGEYSAMVLSLAVASAVSLGVADYLAGVTLRRDGRYASALTYTLVSSLIGVGVVTVAFPIMTPEVMAASDAWWGVAAGTSFGLGMPLLMVGMARGPIALVAPVIGLVSLAVPAVVGPLLGDDLSILEVAGVLVALPAAGLVAVARHPTEDALPVGRALLLAAATGGLFGGAAVFFGQTNVDSGIWPAVVAQVTATVLLAAAALGSRQILRPRRGAMAIAALVGFLAALAVLLSVLAYQRGPVAVVAAVVGLAPGPTVLLARWLAAEHVNRLQVAGFALGVCAVILFAIG